MESALEEPEDSEQLRRGARAEEVAEWFFRLNGFFLIPGFIVHHDYEQPYPRTEADLLGIRLKHSAEGFHSRSERADEAKSYKSMTDHGQLIEAGKDGTVPKHLIAMVEVKAGLAKINGPWSDERSGNMARALRRVGFGNRQETDNAADAMYKSLRYVGRDFVVQYYSVCGFRNDELSSRYPDLIQITFEEIASFLRDRFANFPQKIPQNASCTMWQGFGYDFMRWFEQASWGKERTPSAARCFTALRGYIDRGVVS